jgi:hypothetical protein
MAGIPVHVAAPSARTGTAATGRAGTGPNRALEDVGELTLEHDHAERNVRRPKDALFARRVEGALFARRVEDALLARSVSIMRSNKELDHLQRESGANQVG